ncbi:transposase [Microbacterium sp. 179-I 3D4 NHS]|uniref:transposase n=1 Tax=Microbacterium sp. 179-I 3D4 NHS TaxID=3142381 RepID=UPI0039A193B5
MSDEVSAAAAELYASPLRDFISRRNARAKEAGDRAVADAIRALRKPSVAAWIVNVFAVERAGELSEALELAAELREAQDDLDAPALAKLGRERRALTRRLAEQAGQLARDRGEKVTAGTLDAVQQTISAAFFDRDAAVAVASGRLVRELEPGSGLGFDLDEIVAAGAPPEEVAAPPDEVGARRKRRQAERAVHQAEQEVAQAERKHADAERAVEESHRRLGEWQTTVADLEKELARARGELEKAQRRIPGEEAEEKSSATEVARARRGLESARATLDAL